jgi:hypothetical protein
MFHPGLWSNLLQAVRVELIDFSHNVPAILVAAESGETRVSQSIVRRPFQKLDAGDDEWIQSAAFLHFCDGKALAPPPFCAIRQITERAAWYSELLEMRHHGPTDLGRDASTDACRIH